MLEVLAALLAFIALLVAACWVAGDFLARLFVRGTADPELRPWRWGAFYQGGSCSRRLDAGQKAGAPAVAAT